MTEETLIDPRDLLQNNEDLLCSHYCGNTSGGKYNDSTVKAYFISYYDDRTVKTIYVGSFKDGVFNDYTRDAWSISRNKEKNTMYMYYRGVFKNGSASKNQNERVATENPVSRETIEKLTSSQIYENELNWDEDYIGK